LEAAAVSHSARADARSPHPAARGTSVRSAAVSRSRALAAKSRPAGRAGDEKFFTYAIRARRSIRSRSEFAD
jgi:hypothetical protein